LRSQVFKILTPAQQTQLTALEAQRQARMAAHQHAAPAPAP
jgi:Spy/CpxP family protein refolding chaperone